MKTDTPRTDDSETRVRKNGISSLIEYCYANDMAKLERELTAARAEIERLDTAGIHSCHKDCQRPNCVLRRERDELATCLASEKITRNHIVERASETERELNAARAEIELLKTNLEISFRQTEQAVQDRADEYKTLTEQYPSKVK